MKKKIFALVLIIFLSFPLLNKVHAILGQWSSGEGKIYYSDTYGRVGLGTSTPADPLHILNAPDHSFYSKQGKALVGDLSGSWWIMGNRGTDARGYNNIASNAYNYNGSWYRREAAVDSWIMSTYNSINNANDGYFKLFYAAPQGASTAITNLETLLLVKPTGAVYVKELYVKASGWSDYVFDKDYKLKSLGEVEKYIGENKRLPGIPSEKEILESGLSVGDMQQKQMEKIEELTLYVIDLQKQIDELKN